MPFQDFWRASTHFRVPFLPSPPVLSTCRVNAARIAFQLTYKSTRLLKYTAFLGTSLLRARTHPGAAVKSQLTLKGNLFALCYRCSSFESIRFD